MFAHVIPRVHAPAWPLFAWRRPFHFLSVVPAEAGTHERRRERHGS